MRKKGKNYNWPKRNGLTQKATTSVAVVALFTSLVTLGVVFWAMLFGIPKLVNQIIDGRLAEIKATHELRSENMDRAAILAEDVVELLEKRKELD